MFERRQPPSRLAINACFQSIPCDFGHVGGRDQLQSNSSLDLIAIKWHAPDCS